MKRYFLLDPPELGFNHENINHENIRLRRRKHEIVNL
jgi:hypothetical protein